MTDFIRSQVDAEEMIRPTDLAESVRFLVHVCGPEGSPDPQGCLR